MKKISAIIITYNEEKNIEKCLVSLQDIVDEIIVVDSISKDKTKEICLKYNAIFYERAFTDYSDQKNWAIKQTQYPIVLSIDADEVLSSDLRQSIVDAKNNWKYDAYYFKRLTNFCGRWVKHTGWYPDKQMRLWDKSVGEWDGKKIHEKVKLQEGTTISTLDGDLLHYSFYTIHQHIAQINKFSELKAEAMLEKGKKPNWVKIIFSPLSKFIRHYFIKKGFLDGFAGFVISINSAHSTFLKQVKFRQKYYERKNNMFL